MMHVDYYILTPQTKVGHLGGLHILLGDGIKAVNVWK